jgi:cytosine/uracil/thiamine/allantoin permease
LNIKAPILLALLVWAYVEAHGFGPMLAQPSQFHTGGSKAGQFWAFFFPALTAMIGFWATLSLNIPDFTRYARSQRDQMLGQALGLAATTALYSFIGGILTADYYILRQPQLDLGGLYQSKGPYWYAGGFNPRAIVALAVGIAPCVPGFLGTIGALEVAPFRTSMYHYAWFISFARSAVCYLVLMNVGSKA